MIQKTKIPFDIPKSCPVCQSKIEGKLYYANRLYMCLSNSVARVVESESVSEMFHNSHYALRVGYVEHMDHELYEERITLKDYQVVNCDDTNGIRYYIFKPKERGPLIYDNPLHGRIEIFSIEALQNFLLLQ